MKVQSDKGRERLAGVVLRSQPDNRLVSLVRGGHERAFDEIVRRYRPSLVSFAAGIVPSHHAEDVVQEALSRAHRAMGGDAEINLRPWLYTIVRNRALNALRDQPVHDHLDESFDGVPQPPEVAAGREDLAALTAGVKGLPGPQREAIVKRELEGRSHEEIASSLGVSAGAVRGLIYRARATLRDGIGLLIPMPVLRSLLSAASASPDATSAAGTAAGLAAGGGGGLAVKAGATLGVAVLAVGSGLAVQHRDSSPKGQPEAARSEGNRSADVQDRGGPAHSPALAGTYGPNVSGDEGPGSGDTSGEGSSSGPGPGGGSSAQGSDGGDRGHGSGSGSGGSDQGDSDHDGGGTGGGVVESSGGGSSGGSGGGSSGSGSGDSGSSGSGSGDGSDGGGSSGSGGGGETTTTSSLDGGGTSGSSD